MLHYVEKPSSFVSTTINCGVYLFSLELLNFLSTVFKEKNDLSGDVDFLLTNDIPNNDTISLEKDVFMPLIESSQMFVFHQQENFWWSQIKSPGSAIYANRNYLTIYRMFQPQVLSTSVPSGLQIIGDVYIHPSAEIDPTAIVI